MNPLVPNPFSATPALSRRRFLQQTASALAWGSAALAAGLSSGCRSQNPPGSTGKPLVGSNLYGWTQYAHRDQKPLDVPGIIASLREAGYDYLEGFMEVTDLSKNIQFADQLKAGGLRPVSIYTGGAFHEAGKADQAVDAILAAAKACQAAGFSILSCNPDPIGREKSDRELQTQAAALTRLGTGLNALGMQLGLHHHMPEMAQGAREFHAMFQATPPAAVGFCYDVHWIWKGGMAPAQALEAYGQRIVTWHLRQSRNNVWWEDLDTGDVDYAEVARYARQHKLPRRFTVELALEPNTKITRSAAENHRRSREFVRQVFGA